MKCNLGKLYIICGDSSKRYVICFKDMPTPQTGPWIKSYEDIKPGQLVVAIKPNYSEEEETSNIGNLYYQVLTQQGLVWIHNYDLAEHDKQKLTP